MLLLVLALPPDGEAAALLVPAVPQPGAADADDDGRWWPPFDAARLGASAFAPGAASSSAAAAPAPLEQHWPMAVAGNACCRLLRRRAGSHGHERREVEGGREDEAEEFLPSLDIHGFGCFFRFGRKKNRVYEG